MPIKDTQATNKIKEVSRDITNVDELQNIVGSYSDTKVSQG